MSNPYIRLYNVFTDDSEYKLSSRQLYFYALLDTLKSVFLGYTQTTLTIVCQNQIVFTDKNESRKIDECRSVVLSLVEKNVIELESEPNIKANTPIKIRFPVFKGGFEDIHTDIWEKVSSPDELMVFTMLKRIPGFEKAKDKWSKILGYASKNTGDEIVTRMETDDKIYSVEGKIYTDAQGRTKQLPTKWYIGKKPESKVKTDDDIIFDEIVSEDNSDIEWGHWKKGDLTLNDYILYVNQENNEEFIKVAKAKINRISKNGTNEKVVFTIEQQIEEARKIILNKKRKEDEIEQEKNRVETIANSKGKLLFKDKKRNLVAVDIAIIRGMNVMELYQNYSSLEFETEYEGETRGYDLFDDHSFFAHCYPETKEKVFRKLIEMFEQTGKIGIYELEKYRIEIVKENNAGLPHDVEHEGDSFDIYGPNHADNRSLRERIRKHKVATVDPESLFD
ncbi:hypothetical protein O9H85_08265 [Paenibacillus filicis]|uniref:Uncharacterized protein n=1 Tax=Paenibacillus gyeongsangnamensis TaxID=3388067 RepID=A0ABT4Q6C2_9BACL|nr:hypothetical protein [Paenibacillus filicis]MCZ8512427.1 hypothetical protein [Paenibacillus filicis]